MERLLDNPDRCDLVTPFELYGRWWRANSDVSSAVSGCLSFTPDHGLQLQLYDDLPGEDFFSAMMKPPTHPIWGTVSGFAGKQFKVSLFGEIETNKPNNPAVNEKPAAHTIFYINRAIVGVHSVDLESLRVTSVVFSIVDLESFAGTRVIAPNFFNSDKLTVDYLPRPPIEVSVVNPAMKLRMTNRFGYGASAPDRNCLLTFAERIDIDLASPTPIEEAFRIAFDFGNFFAICSRECVDFRSMRAILESGEEVASFGSMRGSRRRRIDRDWIVRISDFGEKFEEVINRWFALVKKMGFVGPVFFSELSAPSPVQDARFFHFAGCLEAFHREVIQADAGKYLPKSEYRQMVNQLLTHLPTDAPQGLQDAMRSALSSANNFAFAERLDFLFQSLEDDTKKLLTDDQPRFLAAIKRSRNKLAHITDGATGDTFEGKDYAHINLCLRTWLVILMLRECGVPEEMLRQRIIGGECLFWGPFTFAQRPA